jgi:hypothetical protein
MELNVNDGLAKILAFYLPQFEPTPLNDKYYGKGFTEWTNVGKARPLFRGHYQPKVPADLGYYDLRVPEIAIQQAELAQKAGVFGFTYWHYWWSGDMELQMAAERMLESTSPIFPFCFAWANENWYKKLWSKDKKDDILLKDQQYPGKEDNKAHFDYCLPFFKDLRYITFDGRPLFVIYRPLSFPAVSEFIIQWNGLIKDSGVADSFYFVGMMYRSDELEQLKSLGFDCITPQHNLRAYSESPGVLGSLKSHLQAFFGRNGVLRKYNYAKYPSTVWDERCDSREDVAPQLIPNWDNTPRAGRRGLLYKNATPVAFGKAAECVMQGVKNKKNKLVFLKSWNEWAEGNYMEPDLKYGHGFIDALSKAVNENRE